MPASEAPHPSADLPWAALILAGGTSRRWGGRDKTAVPLAGRPVLRHVVDAVLPEAGALAVVAPSDHPARPGVEAAAQAASARLLWTREEPPGGGPLAGLAAGVAALDADLHPAPVVVVLAGDLPFARTALPRLVEALGAAGSTGFDAALGVDGDGRRQPLLAAYRLPVLRRRLSSADPAGKPLRVLITELNVVEVPVSDVEALDLDTTEDAEVAERVAAERASNPATAP